MFPLKQTLKTENFERISSFLEESIIVRFGRRGAWISDEWILYDVERSLISDLHILSEV